MEAILKKLSSETLQKVLHEFCERIAKLPELRVEEIILYGSYARGDADDESDIDIMILSDVERTDIWKVRGMLSDVTSDLSLKYDVMVSPVIQNYQFFKEWAPHLPYYQNIVHEGVTYFAA